jgi:hypothetical protein
MTACVAMPMRNVHTDAQRNGQSSTTAAKTKPTQVNTTNTNASIFLEAFQGQESLDF